MKEVSVEIETFEFPDFVKDFWKEKKLRSGSELEITEGVVLRFEGSTIREAINIPEVVKFTLIVAEHVALPIALGIVANWIYEKIKRKKGEKIRVGNREVQIAIDKIQEMLMKEIREKSPRKIYSVSLLFPEFSEDEVLRAARTLSDKPIILNDKELPYPDNMSYFGKFWKGKVEAIVYIRDEWVNQLYERGDSLHAKAQVDEHYLPSLFFTKLILSSEPIPSGCVMRQIRGKEDMPEWY